MNKEHNYFDEIFEQLEKPSQLISTMLAVLLVCFFFGNLLQDWIAKEEKDDAKEELLSDR